MPRSTDNRAPLAIRLGDVVNTLRKEKGMQQQDLAAALNYSPPMVSLLEGGVHSFLPHLERVAIILDTTAEEIMDEAGVCRCCRGTGLEPK